MKIISFFLFVLLSSTGILRAEPFDTFEYEGLRYMIMSEGSYNYYDELPPLVVVTWQVEPSFFSGESAESLIENYYCKRCTANMNYPNMESVTIPASVEHNGKTYIVLGIDDYAFHGCSSLTKVVINNGINQWNPETGQYEGSNIYLLGAGAFIESGITEITLSKGLYDVGNDCFLMCPLEEFSCTGRVKFGSQSFAGTKLGQVILDGNRMLSGNTFVGCSEMKYVEIKEDYSLTESPSYKIGASDFKGCYHLEKFSVDKNNDSYADIDGVLFNKACTKLIAFPGGKGGNYMIPNGVKEIASFGMAYLPHLKEITIPESVTAIGCGGLTFCDSLKRIIVNNPVPVAFTVNSAMFLDIDKANCILYVPMGSAEAYLEAFGWKDFVNIMEFNPSEPADVNVDSLVNVSDVTTLINMILGMQTTNELMADVNGDGQVNVSDVTALVNKILGVK